MSRPGAPPARRTPAGPVGGFAVGRGHTRTRPRLKTYLFISLTLMTAAPLILLGLEEDGRGRASLRHDADRELSFTAEALARAIGQSVDGNVRALETSAGELEAHQSFDRATLQSIVEIHRRRFPGLAVVNIAGADGKTLASDPQVDPLRGSYIGRDYTDRAYYQQMVRTGRTGISEVETGRVSGIPAIHAKTPIRALTGPQAGLIIGDMGFALALQRLQKLTAEVVSLAGPLEARVIDNRTRVITESDPRGRAVLRDLSAIELYRAPAGAGVVLRDGADENAVPVRAALARVSEQSLNWTVAVTRAKASIEARADEARRTALFALAAALIAGLLGAFALSSWLARPIISLEHYAAQVRAGARPPRPPTSFWNPREVTGLIGTVELMVLQLRARYEELEALRATQEERIRYRTAEINLRSMEMRLLLDNLTVGVFTMDQRGTVGSEHSEVLASWFGAPQAGEPFYRYMGRVSPAFGQHAEIGWEQVVDDMLGLEVALGQLPHRMATADRHYSFSYRAIGDDLSAAGIAPQGAPDGGPGTPNRFLVVVTDITSEIERETMLSERRETLAVFEHMLADRAGFLAFVDEGSDLVARVLDSEISNEELLRALHTLKGNSLSFGLESVSSLCHAIETAMVEEPSRARDDLIPLGERWGRMTSGLNRLLGKRRRIIEMTPEQHAEIERAGRSGASREEILRMIHELTLEPVDHRLRRLADQAQSIAMRLEKPIAVELEHDDLYLDGRRWSPLWSTLGHALRNAIDHGIEDAAARVAAGKTTPGRIVLRAHRDTGGITVEVEDDGGGIDWEALRRCGRDRGLPTDTEGQLVEVLFHDGVTTAVQVTTLSGRGVGMAALRAAVTTLGGRIAVHSRRGLGTRIAMSFPSA
jgi:HPt (histidine-containing phosphotransfer) domain-containing protein